MAKEERKVSIAYVNGPDRFTAAISGAYGGVAPDGNAVVAHFYVDYGSTPVLESHPVSDAGVVDLTNIEVVSQAEITREVQATFVIVPEVARRIGEWLIEKSDAAMASRNRAAAATARQREG